MEDNCIVRSEDSGRTIIVKRGTTLRELMPKAIEGGHDDVIAAYVNNVAESLCYEIQRDITLRYMRVSEMDGGRIYIRTMMTVLFTAARELWPDATFHANFSVNEGFFFTLKGMKDEKKDVSNDLKRKMNAIIAEDKPIEQSMVFWEKALEMFGKEKLPQKISLIESRQRLYCNVDTLDGHHSYFYGPVADRTGMMKSFDIAPFMNGYILMLPSDVAGREKFVIDATKIKMYDTFLRFKDWQRIIGVPSIGILNEEIRAGRADEIIKMCEALQEKNLSMLADEIGEKVNVDGVKIILISGPSSSGKTTFSQRLNIHLRIFGIEPLVVGMDDYFVERHLTPLDENGDKDYEALEAVDIDLFQDHILQLLAEQEVSMPTYNFITGKREYNGRMLRMKEKSVIIIEGIHGLNPKLLSRIDPKLQYKVYVSALTSMSMDDNSYLSTTDSRLLRRIVRDAKYRNRPCEETLTWWKGVRRGEDKYIFPYQNEADSLFSSALLYEMCVLKPLAEPLLLNVPNTIKEYAEATRLLNMLSFLAPIDINLVPPSSLLREFIGGSNY